MDVLEMMWNYRVVRTPKPYYGGYDRGWCFFGKTHADLLRAVMGAAMWDGGDDTAPEGWDKDVNTREISPDGRTRIELAARRRG